MSKMTSIAAMLALAAFANDDRPKVPKIANINPAPIEPPKPKGLKLFNVDGIEIWAINEKNARRKAGKVISVNNL